MKPTPRSWAVPAGCLTTLLILFSLFPSRVEQAGEKGSSDQQIEKLIGQLGNAKYQVRELAQRKLILMDEAVPALQQALKSPDQEVAQRAAEILAAIANRHANQWADKLAILSENGQIDFLVEELVHHWNASRKKEAWQAVGKLAGKLIAWEKQHFQKLNCKPLGKGKTLFDFLLGDFAAFVNHHDFLEPVAPEVTLQGDYQKPFVVRAERIAVKTGTLLHYCVLASSGPIEFEPTITSHCIFLANDLIKGGASSCLIVCDGEFETKDDIGNSLVIARQGVICRSIYQSVILCGGPVRTLANQPIVRDSTIFSFGRVEFRETAKLFNSVIKENQPNPFGIIKFFDPVQVGIEVESANNAVRIKKLDQAKVFAKAGLQAGDVLLALDKNPVKSVEGFRKQLRHSLVVQPQLSFEVRRAEKIITVSVKNQGH